MKGSRNYYSHRGRQVSVRLRASILAVAFATVVAVLIGNLANLIGSVYAMGVAQSIIVQLNDDPAAVWKAKQEKAGQTVSADQLAAYRSSLKNKQDLFLADLQSRGISYTVDGVDVPNFNGTIAGHVDYRYSLVLNGLSLQVPNAAIDVIKALPEVKKVEPNNTFHVQLEKSVDYIRAPLVYGQYQDLTPFDNFPNDGYEGQGINIAVLDTGIDWTNPMFGGDPTPPRLGLAPPTAALNSNQKVIYYMTFTGGLIDDFGHGSHASADAAGYLAIAPGPSGIPGGADGIRLHGVAPQARLMGYKVCTGTGNCLANSTILALEDAVSPMSLDLQPKPIAHVINMSLGGSGGPDDSTAVAADNASLMGAIVVAAAGNEGPGESTVGSPAAGRHVIAAGADNDPASGSNTIDVTTGERTGMIANSLDGSAAVTSDIVNNYVFCGYAETPDEVPNSVSGKIALIARGGTYSATLPVVGGIGTGLFSNKAAFAFAKGAVAAVIYNNVDGELTAATVRKSTIPVLGINKSNGEYLKSLIGSDAVGAVSAKQIRINAAKLFSPSMADFSSRGPVAGLGQVKPDITAPGVNIYSATVRVGGAETNTATMFDPSGFIHASGTSFSTPHTTGASALIKQAHLNWSPDMVRTALINTATNLRSASGVPKADGQQADPIIAQGGGLIDVYGAVNTKALMGVTGDGIAAPEILGSYSFGEAPILNNRIVNTRQVTVTIRDVSGLGGTYNLSTANNRYFDRPGITASVSPSSVVVPAGGSATFTATVSLDGNQVRDTSSVLELQWYVLANRAGSSDTLRMPMYLKASPSLPGDNSGSSVTDTYTGNILLGDAGVQSGQGIFLTSGITFKDVPFSVGPATVKLEATLSCSDAAATGLSDLDLYVLDPDGNSIATSTNSGCPPEHILAPITKAGTYTYRIYGWLAADTSYTLVSTQTLGGAPPILNPIAASFVDNSTGNRYNFDGNYSLTWQANGADTYEIEGSTDGTNWNVVQDVPGNVSSVSFSNAAEGSYSYRVRSIVPGRIGEYVTTPSNVQSIIVAHRTAVDATSSIDLVNSSITFPPGSTQIVTSLKNHSNTTYYPNIRVEITSVSSSGNTVRVSNADNGGDGVSGIAAFDYSQLVGSALAPNQQSGNRTLNFSNPNNIMFTYTARVIANVSTATGSAGTTSASTASSTGTTGSSSTSSPGVTGTGTTHLLQFTVNPLTQTVTVKLL